MSELSERIVEYARQYYEGTPTISDAAFDALVDQLRKTEPNNPILDKVGWGYTVNNPLLTEQRHWYDVAKFENKVKDSSLITIPHDRGKASVKLDGGSVCCYYKNGKLAYAITRGDGITGYDVTDKFKFMVPCDLSDASFTGMVRGEVVMQSSIFNSKYAQNYESARNLAIGMIKRNSITLNELHDIDFVAYTVRGVSDIDISSKSLVYNWLLMNHFNKVDELTVTDWSDDGLRVLIKSYTKYLIDGIVITDELYDKLDDDTYVPHSEIAYKTASDTAVVTVEDVTWNLTRTGLLYPRVWFTPVKLSGATVRKATAFNADFVESEGIGKGAELVIRRSGEVIPDIVEVIKRATPELPTVCPECGSKLIRATHLQCTNPECSGQSLKSLIHWINVVAGIKGMGTTMIVDFLETFDISNIDELYSKRQYCIDNIDQISGDATKQLLLEMLSMLVEPIQFNEFMKACNLPMIGDSACDALIPYRQLVLEDSINESWTSKINDIPGVNITGKLSIQKNISRIRRYATLITVMKIDSDPLTKPTNDPDKIITITGKLSVGRKQFVELIKPYGWSEGPINKAKYLVTDNPDSGSSKCKNAKKLGVPIISELDFMDLIKTN